MLLFCNNVMQNNDKETIYIMNKLSITTKTTILALSWRDIRSPKMGGAETHTHEMLRRVDHEKYRVIHFAPMYPGLLEEENIDGVNYLRKGSIFSVIWYAMIYYKKNAKNIDFVIEQCNTHRFFTRFWVPAKKRIFYIHQLTREIWNIEMHGIFATIGRKLENPMLRLQNNDYAITVSDSTKSELIEQGFQPEKIFIVNPAIHTRLWTQEEWFEKDENPTFVYVGRYARYKGIDVAIEALGIVKREHTKAKLWIIGKENKEYVEDVLKPLCSKLHLEIGHDEYADVVLCGFVSEEKKLELQSRALALLFPSIREGWGLIITEAAMVGTPSIVFDAPGSRDAVNFGEAGYLCSKNDAGHLAEYMENCIENPEEYEKVRKAAYEFSSQFTWDNMDYCLDHIIEAIKEREV